jgi:hypothetical protein
MSNYSFFMDHADHFVRNFDLTADICEFTSRFVGPKVEDKVVIGMAHTLTAVVGPLAALVTAVVRVAMAPFVSIAGMIGSTYNFVARCLGKEESELPTLIHAFYNIVQIVKQVVVGIFILPFVGGYSPEIAATRLFPSRNLNCIRA